MKKVISSKKIKQRTITKLREKFDKIDTIEPHFNEGDKKISFDGFIELYKGNIDKKENFESQILVQIKERTSQTKINKKKSASINIDKSDILNYKKVDGILLFVVYFSKNDDSYCIFYKSLLPIVLSKIINENKTNNRSKWKIKLDKLEDGIELENICRNFMIQQNLQKKNEKFINNGFTSNTAYILKIFENTKDKFNSFNLVGKEQCLYFYDKENNLKNITLGMVESITEKINCSIKSKDGSIKYNNILYLKSKKNEEKIEFGKSFEIILGKEKINIKIQGSFKERLKDLKFIKSIIDYNGFYIKDDFFCFSLDNNKDSSEMLYKLYDNYLKIDNFFKKASYKKRL